MNQVNEGLFRTLTNAALLAKIMKDTKPSFWTTVLLMVQANKVKGRAGAFRKGLKGAALTRLARKGFKRRKFRERVLDKLTAIQEGTDYPAVVKKWAKDANVPIKEVMRRYEKAAKLASKKFDAESERWWKYKMGIFKQMMYKYPGQNQGGRGTKAIKAAAKK